MAFIDKFCPNCMNILKKKDSKCSNCGMLVSDMQRLREKQATSASKQEKKQADELKEPQNLAPNKEVVVTEIGDGGAIVDTSKFFDSDTDVSTKDGKNTELLADSVKDEVSKKEETAKRHKHKRKLKNNEIPQYTVDEDGSYNIDTSDVTYLEGVTPSIRKARGDAPKEEKFKWWEIYKWADKMLAKRKINKEVKKAATKIPAGISKGKMIAWCVFFGWLGIHNFYGGNKKKGWLVVVSDVIIFTIINVSALYKIMGVFVGGGLGFLVLSLWITDFFGLIFNKYKYRISKEEFISNLNVETRAKLGDKFVNLDKSVFKQREQERLEKKSKKKKKRKDKKLENEYNIVSHKMD